MKKYTILALSVLMVIVFISNVSALENKFGGYWRIRIYTQQNFTGEDVTEAKDITQVDNRTRLYYTAIFSENFKFVNKFEFDAIWGDNPKSNTYGDIGADGISVEIKNSYLYFALDSFDFKVGVKPFTICRKFLFSKDAAGVEATYKGDSLSVPFYWVKGYEGSSSGGLDANHNDVDYYGVAPSINLNKFKITPTLLWVTSQDGSEWGSTSAYKDFDSYYIGLDLDAKLDFATLWFTGIYQTGEVETSPAGVSQDISAWLAGIGGKADIGPANIHGQLFYATGDDDSLDNDLNAYFVPSGDSYYWSEIMGLGTFDNQASANSPKSNISNIMAANLGISYNLTDKLNMTADLWYATLAEDDANGEDVLGTEVDLVLSYKIRKKFVLSVIGAYLFAGDATYNGADDANPYEIGTQLSLKF